MTTSSYTGTYEEQVEEQRELLEELAETAEELESYQHPSVDNALRGDVQTVQNQDGDIVVVVDVPAHDETAEIQIGTVRKGITESALDIERIDEIDELAPEPLPLKDTGVRNRKYEIVDDSKQQEEEKSYDSEVSDLDVEAESIESAMFLCWSLTILSLFPLDTVVNQIGAVSAMMGFALTIIWEP